MNEKEVLIAKYALLENAIKQVTLAMTSDPDIKHLTEKQIAITSGIAILKEPFETSIQALYVEQDEIKETLKTSWDIEDKTYKCNAGTATLRTTKSLEIRDKNGLIGRLGELFVNEIEKATGYITGFDLRGIRKLKDAGLISDKIAHYEVKRNVAIKVTED